MSTENPIENYTQRWASQALTAAIDRGDSEILVRGPRGVGKTIDLCWRFHNYAKMYPGMTQIWCRSTRSRLTDSVLKTFENEVLGKRHPLYSTQQREQRSHYRYPNGSEIVLMGLDDPERQKSVSGDIIWVNEPTEITEAQWEEVGGTTRPQIGGPCPFRLKIGDYNPGPPDHWTEKRCRPLPTELYPRVRDDGTRMGEWLTAAMYGEITRFNNARKGGEKTKLIVYCAADNPGYWSMSPWGWDKNGLEYAREFLGKMSGTRKARYLEGRPKADEGAVYPEWDEDIHVVDDFYPPPAWPQMLCYDPGYGTSAVEFLTIAPDGGIFVFDEIYEHGWDISRLCAEINRRKRQNGLLILRDMADVHEAFSNASQGASVADQARRLGPDAVRFVRSPEARGKDYDAGVEMVRTLLLGQPGKSENYLRVCRRCKGLRSNFSAWGYAKNRSGEVVEGAERYEVGNDHGIDCLRYSVTSRFLQSIYQRQFRDP